MLWPVALSLIFLPSCSSLTSSSYSSRPYTSVSSESINDLLKVFTTHLPSSHIIAALKHEEYQPLFQEQYDAHYLICSNYRFSPQLYAYLQELSPQSNDYHPVFHSKKADRSCAMTSGSMISSIKPEDINLHHFTVTKIPHIVKLHESTSLPQNEKIKERPITLEFAYGLGVGAKGSHLQSIHEYSIQFLHLASKILSDDSLLEKHWNAFYWTTDSKFTKTIQKNLLKPSELSVPSTYSELMSFPAKHRTVSQCNFNTLQIQTSKSHILYTTSSHLMNANCMRFLTTVASLQSEISFVSISRGESFESMTQRSNAPYEEADPATDQNAWIQSGTSTETPYTDLGIDGSGYLLGMIDTGLDDLSCFLIDSSGEQTTRTPRANYTNPVTEMFRRKVVQYIAWADGEPSLEYDHGTWCSGASLGNCINSTSSASAYNGVAPNAKISIFDVDFARTENYLNVPSLYDIALPIAYNVGARVHSNSWTTYYMSSYTSKSIDVDEFTYENPDFLFIAGAGNSGDTGYNSVTAPANSKNGIAVGASSVDHNNIVFFSSLGSAYDTAFKPNIVTPGRNLQSAGVRMVNQTDSCNVEISSGTSMATPIAAGSAILIRHYFENSSYWGKFCNANYKSCPVVVPSKSDPSVSDFISSALLRAAIIHSGEPMNTYESRSTNMLPASNLTYPPNNYEGWGQLRLSSVLPLPNKYDFDLYVSDYVTIESLTRHTYSVSVSDSSMPLKVTIAWVDPPNIIWAAKGLLNDIDLILIMPSGTPIYGNSIIGDEFNTQEKVVLDSPPIGEYQVIVQSKIFAVQTTPQKYGIVVTSKGSVTESKFKTQKISVDDLETSDLTCFGQENTQPIQFQLEDWYEGESFQNESITLTLTNSKTSLLQSECQFTPNADQYKAEFTRTSQCTVCLAKNTKYTAQLSINHSSTPVQNIPRVVRAVSPQCNIFLSSFHQQSSLSLNDKGDCNSCSSGGLITATMYANVTDDDESQYSWYGLASYAIHFTDGTQFASGTLAISDEQADRYCINKGTYVLSFNDTLLYSAYKKHGEVVFTLPDGTSVTFDQTSSSTVQVTIPDTKNNNDDDDHGLSQGQLIGISIGGAVLGVVIIGGFLYMYLRKESTSETLLPQSGSTK